MTVDRDQQVAPRVVAGVGIAVGVGIRLRHDPAVPLVQDIARRVIGVADQIADRAGVLLGLELILFVVDIGDVHGARRGCRELQGLRGGQDVAEGVIGIVGVQHRRGNVLVRRVADVERDVTAADLRGGFGAVLRTVGIIRVEQGNARRAGDGGSRQSLEAVIGILIFWPELVLSCLRVPPPSAESS